MSAFCPDLQLPWSLQSIEAQNLDCVTIRVRHAVRSPAPESMGKHVSDIMSQPDICTIITEAEFVFRQCLSVLVQDEMFASISEDRNIGEGVTFLRFLDSTLINAARLSQVDDSPLFHYRLSFQDEIIDVVCGKVPNVTLKHSQPPVTGQ